MTDSVYVELHLAYVNWYGEETSGVFLHSFSIAAICMHARYGMELDGVARFQEEVDPVDYVEQLAEQMLPFTRFEDLHILKGPYIMEDWDPELIEVRNLKLQ